MPEKPIRLNSYDPKGPFYAITKIIFWKYNYIIWFWIFLKGRPYFDFVISRMIYWLHFQKNGLIYSQDMLKNHNSILKTSQDLIYVTSWNKVILRLVVRLYFFFVYRHARTLSLTTLDTCSVRICNKKYRYYKIIQFVNKYTFFK